MPGFLYLEDEKDYTDKEFIEFHRRRRRIDYYTMLLAALYLTNLSISLGLLLFVKTIRNSLSNNIVILIENLVVAVIAVYAFNKFKF